MLLTGTYTVRFILPHSPILQHLTQLIHIPNRQTMLGGHASPLVGRTVKPCFDWSTIELRPRVIGPRYLSVLTCFGSMGDYIVVSVE